MPLCNHDLLRQPIIECLHDGERPAWEIEDELARQFNITPAERAERQRSGMPVWENDISFGLKKLVEAGVIELVRTERAPNGGTRGIYRLTRI
jgi:hypothetical protein